MEHTCVVKDRMASSRALSWLGGREIKACRQPGCGWAAAQAADVVFSSTTSALHAGCGLRQVMPLVNGPCKKRDDTSAEYISGSLCRFCNVCWGPGIVAVLQSCSNMFPGFLVPINVSVQCLGEECKALDLGAGLLPSILTLSVADCSGEVEDAEPEILPTRLIQGEAITGYSSQGSDDEVQCTQAFIVSQHVQLFRYSDKARPAGRRSPDTQQLCLPLLQGPLKLLVVHFQLVSVRSQAIQFIQLAAHADEVLCLPELLSLPFPESIVSELQMSALSSLIAAAVDASLDNHGCGKGTDRSCCA